jgi:hypothetical protein
VADTLVILAISFMVGLYFINKLPYLNLNDKLNTSLAWEAVFCVMLSICSYISIRITKAR